MDWFSWLSKSGLEPTVVYSYSVAFSDNELEEDDIAFFNHEFLLSMGISIAKHRLEILKLVSNYNNNNNKTKSRSLKTLLFAMKKTKQCLGKYFRSWTGLGSDSANSDQSKSALVLINNSSNHNYQMKRNIYYNNNNSSNKKKKLVVGKKQGRLMITNGNPNPNPKVVSSGRSRVNSFSSSPLVFNNHLVNNNGLEEHYCDNNHNHNNNNSHDHDDDDDHQEDYAVEDIRWDSLFQDLKPT